VQVEPVHHHGETGTLEDVEVGVVEETHCKGSAVPEKKSSQILELRNSNIRETSSLISFSAKYPNAYMCFLDHADIISPISNSQSSASFDVLPHKLYYVCFL
jgi:hypothetical protein